jgi:predicted nucleotidyltransferase
MNQIAITGDQKKIVIEILLRHFPNAQYFVFGSRATQKNLKIFSDLDLAIQDNQVIDVDLLSRAVEDFSSSNLPFKVDLVDLRSVSLEFINKIQADLVSLK